MAKKYTIPFKSLDNKDCVIDIYINGATGDVIELVAGANPFVIEQDRTNSSVYTKGVIDTYYTINAWSQSGTNLFSFNSNEYGDVYFKYYENEQLLHTGILNPFESGSPYLQDGLYAISLSAESGIKNLKDKEFRADSGAFATGKITLAKAVSICLKNLHIPNEYPIQTRVGIETYIGSTKKGVTGDFFTKLIDAESFKTGTNTWMSCFEVLEAICSNIFDLYFDHDRWVIDYNADYLGTNHYIYNFDASGNFIDSTSGLISRTNINASDLKGNESYLFSKKNIKIAQGIKSVKNSLLNGVFQASGFDILNWTNENSFASSVIGGTGTVDDPFYFRIDGSVYGKPSPVSSDTQYIESTAFDWKPYGAIDFADRESAKFYDADERLKLNLNAEVGSGINGHRVQIIATFQNLRNRSTQSVINDPTPTIVYDTETLYLTNDGWSTDVNWYTTGSSNNESIEIPAPSIRMQQELAYRSLVYGFFDLETPPTVSVKIRLFRGDRKKIGSSISEESGYVYQIKYFAVGASIWAAKDEALLQGKTYDFYTSKRSDRRNNDTINSNIYNPVAPYAYGSIYDSTDTNTPIDGFKRRSDEPILTWVNLLAIDYLKANDSRLVRMDINRYAFSRPSTIFLNGSRVFRAFDYAYDARKNEAKLTIVEVKNSDSTVQLKTTEGNYTDIDTTSTPRTNDLVIGDNLFSVRNKVGLQENLKGIKTINQLGDERLVIGAGIDIVESLSVIAPSGGKVTVSLEDTENDYTQIKPAASGTYALEEWVEENAWMLGGNTLTSSQAMGSIAGDFDIPVLRNNVEVGKWRTGGLTVPTLISSNLTANYVPKHTASGLVNSQIFDDDTNVGIGTASPEHKLQVAGGIYGTGSTAPQSATVSGYGIGATGGLPYQYSKYTAGATDTKIWDNYSDGANLVFRAVNDANTAAPTWMQVNRTGTTINRIAFPNGNVGIGTTSPTEKLDVNGTIRINTSGSQILKMGVVDTLVRDSSLGTTTIATNNSHIILKPTNGFIGLGTVNPVSGVTIGGTGNPGQNLGSEIDYNGLNITFQTLNGINFTLGGIKMVQPTSAYTDAGDMVFSTSYGTLSEQLRITSLGYVGINKTNPTEYLDVNGTIKATGLKLPNGAVTGYVLKVTDGATGATAWQAATIGERWKGTWDASSGSAPSASPTEGDYYSVIEPGTYAGVTYPDNSYAYYNGTSWVFRPNGYELAIASAGTLGGIRVGSGLSIESSTGILSRNTLVAADIPSLDWSKITTGKPTTKDGYGITDVYTITESDGRFVHLEGDEDVYGIKNFQNNVSVSSGQVLLTTSFINRGGSAASYGVMSNVEAGLTLDVPTNGGLYYRVNNVRKALFDTNGLILSNSLGNTDVPTERLHVIGNIRYSTTLKPNNVQGTAGTWLKNNGSGNPDTWSDITHSDISNLSAYTGFDARYFTETESDARYVQIGTSVNLTTGVTGVLPIANGGTGSSTRNFVDFVTSESVGGNKTFTGTTYFGSGGSLNISTSPFGATIANTSGQFMALNTVGFGTIRISGSDRFGVYNAGVRIGTTTLSGITPPTERLQVDGNIRYNTLLKPNNVAGTAGQFLSTSGTQDAWAFITSADITDVNAANKLLKINSSGLIDSQFLPAYVDDVLEFANLAAFPTTGETGKIYVAIDANRQYRWSGSSYVQIVDGKATWGGIDGTLSAQTDLQAALNARQPLASNLTAISDLTANGLLKRISGTWQMVGQIAMSEVNGLSEILPLKQDVLNGGTGLVYSSGGISYINGTAGQILTKDSGGNPNFMSLNINPHIISHESIAVGDYRNYLSEQFNFKFRDKRYLSIERITDSDTSIELGLYRKSNNAFIKANGGTLDIDARNGLYLSAFASTGRALSIVTIDASGRLSVSAFGSGGSGGASDIDSVLGIGNTAVNKTAIFQSDSTAAISIRSSLGIVNGTFTNGTALQLASNNKALDITGDTALNLYSNGAISLGTSSTSQVINLNGMPFNFNEDSLFQGANKWGLLSNSASPQNGDMIAFMFYGGKMIPMKMRMETLDLGSGNKDYFYLDNL